jgi:uncharacterized protein YbjT (DUF2867 family)
MFAFGVPLWAAMAAPLVPGDTVAVIGASGNVGKLVALRLGDKFRVRAVTRDPERLRPYFAGKDSVTTWGVELKGESAASDLRAALAGAHAVVVCTGTTAFPTKAWSPDGKTEVTLPVLKSLVDSRFDVRAAVSALDAQGFNTPRNIDTLSNLAVLDAWREAAGKKRKRFVLMSSIGVQRRSQMPFPILNACGVLDAKAEAEAAIAADAVRRGWPRRHGCHSRAHLPLPSLLPCVLPTRLALASSSGTHSSTR